MGTRGQWAKDFLASLGNNSPSEDTIKLVAAWTKAENTRAAYNPLATTQHYNNSTDFNSAGVQNFNSYGDGIWASVETLQGNFVGYSGLRTGLLNNDPTRAIASGGFDTWGSHTSHVLTIYETQDVRNENLLSDDAGIAQSQTNEHQHGGTANVPQDTQTATTTNQTDYTAGPVQADDIKNIGKTLLGTGLIGVGAIIFIVSVVKQENIQDAIKLGASAL